MICTKLFALWKGHEMEFVIYETITGHWVAAKRGGPIIGKSDNITEASQQCFNYVVNNVEYPYPTIKIVILGDE